MDEIKIVTKKYAMLNGLPRYFTGKPCKNGHLSERYTFTSRCVQCGIENKPYQDNWRKKNREKCKKYTAEWRLRNPEYSKNYTKKYRELNPEYRQQYEKRRWAKNKDKLSEKRKKHQKENKELWATYSRNRRAALKNCEGYHTKDDILNIGNAQNWECAYCKKSIEKKYTADHIIAISKGGTNWPENIQLLCLSCNSSKNNKDADEWAKKMGYIT